MFSSSLPFFGKVLVVGEFLKGNVSSATLSAITAGTSLGPVSLLVTGKDAPALSKKASSIKNINNILFSKQDEFTNGLAEPLSNFLQHLIQTEKFTHVCAGSSAFSKSLLPRAAALMDVMPIPDVISIQSEELFTRLLYAGSIQQKIKSKGPVHFLTIRATSFARAESTGGSAAITEVTAPVINNNKENAAVFIQNQPTVSEKVDLSTASIVIGGGRGLKNAENFKLLYELAEPLKAAVGATRAVVDAGYVSNDLQIGQTGKTVAPNLYIGCGVSGAIQHLAGMKDSKVIAVINTDEEAPFFQVADYGLVGDLFQAVPKLTEKVKGK